MPTIEITRPALDGLREEAERASPLECCGLLLGTAHRIEAIRPAANVAAQPRTHFEIDPRALIDAYRAERAGGPRLTGFYHSHPEGPAAPSATDRDMAAGDGRVWAITGRDGTTFWLDDPQGFQPLFSRAVDG